jgi:hypothetical protein
MHLVILVWPTRVRMEARHKAATAIELPKEGRTVPSGPNEDSGRSPPFLSHHILQNGPRRQGSATPRKTSAPLTAGRSTDSNRYERKGASELRLRPVVAPPVGRRWTYTGLKFSSRKRYETTETEKALQEGHPHGSQFCSCSKPPRTPKRHNLLQVR